MAGIPLKDSSSRSERKIVLVGKTGVGKSSLANTLFGEKVFNPDHSSRSGKDVCKSATKEVMNTRLTLIETPGLLDTERSEEELRSEIIRSILEFSPGVHMFLIVLKVEKFTEDEERIVTKICEYFSEEVLKYSVIVFTHGEQLKKKMTIQQFVDQNEKLKDLVKKCGDRCHVFDSKYWKNNDNPEIYRRNSYQLKDLLNTGERLEKSNKGEMYTNEMLQKAEQMIKKHEKEIRKTKESSSPPERRIVLVGKTGVGKSSLGNTLFGEKVFDIDHSTRSGTLVCKSATKEVMNTKLTLIDTPVLFDTGKSEEELRSEIISSIVEFSPGVHVFLIVFKVEKFTKHEEEVITRIFQYFSEEILKYSVIVFTHGDLLKEGTTIQKFVDQNKNLKDLVKKCGDHCHVFDSKFWRNDDNPEKYRRNSYQLKQLLNTVERLVRNNNGGFYTNEMLQKVHLMIQKQKK